MHGSALEGVQSVEEEPIYMPETRVTGNNCTVPSLRCNHSGLVTRQGNNLPEVITIIVRLHERKKKWMDWVYYMGRSDLFFHDCLQAEHILLPMQPPSLLRSLHNYVICIEKARHLRHKTVDHVC